MDDSQEIIDTLRDFNVWQMYRNALPLDQLIMTGLVLIGAVVIVAALIRCLGNGSRSGLLSTLGLVALLAGLLSAAYDGWTLLDTARMTHVTRFVVVLPSVLETMCVFGLGWLVWTIAALGNAGARQPVSFKD